MKYVLSTVCLLIWISLNQSSCKKKESSPPVVSSRISKMEGIHNWHGTYRYSCWLCVPYEDTTYELVDTFGWIVVDSSTIAVQNLTFYGFDTLKLVNSNDTILQFERYHNSRDWETVTYYFQKKSMHYDYYSGSSGAGVRKKLYTP